MVLIALWLAMPGMVPSKRWHIPGFQKAVEWNGFKQYVAAGLKPFSKRSLECIHRGALSVIMACGLMPSFPACAVDVLPAAYTSVPAGTDAVFFFYTYTERDKLYVKGNKVPIDARLDSENEVLRYSHFFDVSGYLADVTISVPFGTLDARKDSSVLGNANGLSDLILASSIWLVNRPETRTYFAIAPFLTLPTGDYDKNKALNLGENRWKLTVQGGLNTGLSDKVDFDLDVDATVYGKNNDFGVASAVLKQDPSYQIQTYLRYRFSPVFEGSTGLSYVWGGENELNGVRAGNSLRTSKLIFVGAYTFLPTTQLAALYSRDISVENGFMESNRLLLRLTRMF